MFFILAYSRDGGKTWEDQFNNMFQTGEEAQKEAKDLNSYYKSGNHGVRYRVRRVVDSDNDNFVNREKAKGFITVTTDGLPDYTYWPYWRLPHIDPENKRHVRFFRSLSDAIEGKYTSMLMSRFFGRSCDLESEDFDQKLIDMGFYDGVRHVEILRDADQIQDAYENGPCSCMNDPDNYPLGDIHPSRVYASPDLGLAVLKNGNDCVARTVIWPDKKIYGRIYGHSKLLADDLKKLGYRNTVAKTAWVGARLLKIFDEGADAYVMPYLDMSPTVSSARGGKYFRIAGDRGIYCSQECTGYLDTDGRF